MPTTSVTASRCGDRSLVHQSLMDDPLSDHAICHKAIKMLQVVAMSVTCTDLDLDSVGFMRSVVEAGAIGKHTDHAFTCLLGSDKSSNVVMVY